MNKSQHILITGIGGNLGQSASNLLSAQGHRITGIWSPGKRPIEKQDVDFEVDLTNESASIDCIAQITSKRGNIDSLIACAGGFESGTLTDTSLDSVKNMMRLNFDTVWNVARPVFLRMIQQDSPGRIVLVGARPAFDPDRGKGAVAYALSKSALNELAKLINASASPKDIVCSIIVPGTIDTPQNRAWAGEADISSWVKPEELVNGIEYLIGPDAGKLRKPILQFYGD